MNVTSSSSATATPSGAYDGIAQSAASATTASTYVGQSGITFDHTKVTLSSTGPSAVEQSEIDYRNLVKRQTPMLQADSSMKVIEQQLGKVQKAIARDRPDLASESWDFTVEGGKLKVSGTLSKDDKQWIEARLNGNDSLVSAVKSYTTAVTAYLETTEDNPAYMAMNAYDGKVQPFNFKDVQKQLEGKLSFKDLVNTTMETFKNPSTGAYGDPGDYRGFRSIEVIASRLTALPLT